MKTTLWIVTVVCIAGGFNLSIDLLIAYKYCSGPARYELIIIGVATTVLGFLASLAGSWWSITEDYRDWRYRRYLARQPKPKQYEYRQVP